MPDQPVIKPPSHREDAMAVLLRLREAGHVAYFAGGCVRDLLLGHEPKDFDVATDAPPDRVRQLFSNTQAVGAAFGVILVRHKKSVIEVATFRSDGTYTDGRRPDSVRFTTAEEDAKRRDFTINGLFLDPVENKVIDYVGGQADLAAKVVRAIGVPAERFAEDHLRMLRAVRFAARLGFAVAPATAAAIRENAGSLKTISPERIADELRRMLTPPTRDNAFGLLRQLGLFDTLFRFLAEPSMAPAEAKSIFLALGRPICEGSISFGLALAAAALDFERSRNQPVDSLLLPLSAKKITRAMRQSLKISNDEADEVGGSLAFGPMLQGEPSLAATKRFLARPTSSSTRLLMAAINSCGLLSERIDPLLRKLDEVSKEDVAPPPLVTGDNLIAAGYYPGPAFKKVLDQVYDAQLESRVLDKAAAMELAIRLITHAK